MHPSLLFTPLLPLLSSASSLLPRSTITIDPSKTYQTIDGFGFSGAFQRANLILNMPEPKRTALLDLLFNTTTGAGFSIVRNGIGSSPDSSSDHMNTIEPKSPGSATAAASYSWDGKDSGQLWVSQQAVRYGVRTFYANAWSAPGFMKTNNNDANGGYLCGVSGQTCSSGDWKQAYANYLVQLVKYYANAGVNITHLGFLNEPQISTSYASMQSSGQQASDFIKVLSSTLLSPSTNLTIPPPVITCCDSEGWNEQSSMMSQIKSSGAESLLGVVTSHTYTSSFSGPMGTTRKVWQSEYADLNGGWTAAWYSNGAAGEGMVWAGTIMNALTNANMSGYLYWVATQNSNTNEPLIKADATSYTPSKRVWAFAQFSRYIRPGAVRVGTSGASGVSVSAFINNADNGGSLVIPVLNTGTSAQSVTLSAASYKATNVTAWITDNSHEMANTAATLGSDGSVSGSIPARSIVTFVLTK